MGKERDSNTYSSFVFFGGFILVEVPYAFVQTLLFSAIFFPMVGFTGVDTFFLYWFVMFIYTLSMIFLGQLMAWALPALNVAFVLQQLMLTIFSLFMGFNPPEASIPTGLKFIYYLAYPRYALCVIGAAIFGHCPTPGGSEIGCNVLTDLPPAAFGTESLTVAQFVSMNYNFDHDNLVTNLVVLICVLILFMVLGAISIRQLNWQRR